MRGHHLFPFSVTAPLSFLIFKRTKMFDKSLILVILFFSYVTCTTNCTFIRYDENTKTNYTTTQRCVVGHCGIDRCICDDHYFGEECTLSPVNNIVFGIAACDTLVLVFAIYRTIQFKKVTKKFTMKYITLAFILFGLLVRYVKSHNLLIKNRTVWQWETAARLSSITLHIWYYADTILFSLFYPCIICAYTIELFMWYVFRFQPTLNFQDRIACCAFCV